MLFRSGGGWRCCGGGWADLLPLAAKLEQEGEAWKSASRGIVPQLGRAGEASSSAPPEPFTMSEPRNVDRHSRSIGICTLPCIDSLIRPLRHRSSWSIYACGAANHDHKPAPAGRSQPGRRLDWNEITAYAACRTHRLHTYRLHTYRLHTYRLQWRSTRRRASGMDPADI